MKKIIAFVYLALLTITNVFLVPFNVVYHTFDDTDRIEGIVYSPIWYTKAPKRLMNGSPLRYDLNIPRVIHMFLFLSIIFFIIYKFSTSYNKCEK
ncbi:hypothetical protein ACER0A_003245 [Haloimpatiens sp. FM7315]|uniref:hypothetical protein n=1 Tax=Haloimpatiens sp. FM7315 TaxID=3298609 RepID=UPI0035A39D18